METDNNHPLERFIEAQEKTFDTALAEIENGQKRSHWMWFIFPQIAGLGKTDTSKFYAIKDIKEATDYLMDDTLGKRLVDCCKALLLLPTDDAEAVFGSPDHLKLHSSITLFDAVPATFPVFEQVLDKFYQGKRDQQTLNILTRQKDLQ